MRRPRERSTNAKGSHGEARSRRWLERQGRAWFYMKQNRLVYTPAGVIPIKRDQLGCDLGYLDVEAGVVVFVSVKSGASARGKLSTARRKFAAVRWPAHTRREVHVWAPRAREPEVTVCE